jgi:hypothetical protein
MTDHRQYAPATVRNRDFILDVLGMSCRRRVSSSKSQAARASTSFIFRETSPVSFSTLPILNRMPYGVSPHGRRQQTSRMCGRPLFWTPHNQFGRSLRLTDHLHQHRPHLALKGDGRIDQEGGRVTSSGVTALSLWSVQTQRIHNGPEQPSVRPEPSRSQPNVGSARRRGGRCDSAIRWILAWWFHR